MDDLTSGKFHAGFIFAYSILVHQQKNIVLRTFKHK